MTEAHTLKTALQALAADLGFLRVGFAPVTATPHHDVYERWIASGEHGEMDYLARHMAERADPRARLASARTAMVLAMPHHPGPVSDPGGLTGRVARYAWGRDYHNLISKALKKLKRTLREWGIACWAGVDTAPISERAWASAAGLGVNGKNCVQFLPAHTSWMFLAVVFLDAEIPADAPIARDHCGRCTRCLDACPTGAFVGPRHLDARRCISYWTIEAPGLPPLDLRPGFGRWVFGCDVCQEVCPHNARPHTGAHPDFSPRFPWLDLPELLATPDDVLMERFTGMPLRRPKAHGLKRNALIVLGNLAHPDGLAPAEAALAHPEPVVRAAAVWSLARMGADVAAQRRDDHPMVEQELAAVRSGAVVAVR